MRKVKNEERFGWIDKLIDIFFVFSVVLMSVSLRIYPSRASEVSWSER